jgi:uncharacterized protein
MDARTPSLWPALAIAVSLVTTAPAGAQSPAACPVGAYRLGDGQVVDIGASAVGLRWRRLDGTTGKLTSSPDGWRSTSGWTGRPDGIRVTFGACPSETINFGGVAGRRLPLRTYETTFASHGVQLAGRLVLPPGDGQVPIVVLLQGSEHDSARDFDALQRLFPANGIGAFVYDKRGTGASQGAYSQDFWLLADDAVGALREAKRLAGPRAGRIGLQGPSQGGWVAPIAATKSSPDFIIVSFGLAVSVIDEDQEAVALEMRLKGHGPAEIAKALEVAGAAEALVESRFTQGFDELEAVRAKYGDEPWYKDVHGNFTHFILAMSASDLREKGAAFGAPFRDTPFRYDPMSTIEAVKAPQLWVLGGQDLDAPSENTARRLKSLIAKGRAITLAIYPTAEHGMTEFEVGPAGERASTRYAEGYFRLMRDFARDGGVRSRYGDALLTRPKR